MAKLNDDQRRALEMLAHQDGCAEAALLADGFSIDQLAGLVVQGYAVMQRRRVDNQRSDEDRRLDADHRGGPEGDRWAGLSITTPATLASRTPREKPTRYIDIPAAAGQEGTSGFSSAPLADRQPAM
jgi:hypothetical protein